LHIGDGVEFATLALDVAPAFQLSDGADAFISESGDVNRIKVTATFSRMNSFDTIFE
jgi:hypothetical protein